MPGKPPSRKWNDVQTAIATVAIVSTLGLWNLFATPSKAKAVQASEPAQPPPTEPPVDVAVPTATALPYVKIFFTPGATQTTVIQQQVQQTAPKKKKRNNNKNNSGSASVTQTKSS